MQAVQTHRQTLFHIPPRGQVETTVNAIFRFIRKGVCTAKNTCKTEDEFNNAIDSVLARFTNAILGVWEHHKALCARTIAQIARRIQDALIHEHMYTALARFSKQMEQLGTVAYKKAKQLLVMRGSLNEFSGALPRLASLHAYGLISTEFFLPKVYLLLTCATTVEQVKTIATELMIRALTGFNAEGRRLNFNEFQWSMIPTKLHKLGFNLAEQQRFIHELLKQSADLAWKEEELETDDPRYATLFSLCNNLAKTGTT